VGNFAWTDETIAKLRTLYAAGLSATVIARRLGCSSRGMVCGKIHRLALGKRSKVWRTGNAEETARKRPKKKAPAAKASKLNVDPAFDKIMARMASEELMIPMDERKTVLTVGYADCRWPIGDPMHDDFHFCGKGKLDGLPYCEFHARKAFQPQVRRTGRDFADLQRKQRERKTA
jgi:GcrA cell cycle regulator